jgi:hypothetical protein
MKTFIQKINTLGIIVVLTLLFSNVLFGQTQNNNEKKTIVFIDDFDTNSKLEPDYYLYFEKIKEGQLFGDLNYERLNVDFDISGPKSIRQVDLSYKPDFVVLILGTSATTLNPENNTPGISPTDYKNEYVEFVKRVTPHGSIIIVASPPPYPTESEEEDKKIIENINAVQDIAESSKYRKIHYIKLYKHILHNYQESSVSPKELSTWLVRLIKDDVKELDN